MHKQLRINAEVREEASRLIDLLPVESDPKGRYLASVEIALLESRLALMKVLGLQTITTVEGEGHNRVKSEEPNPDFYELENEIIARRNVLRGL